MTLREVHRVAKLAKTLEILMVILLAVTQHSVAYATNATGLTPTKLIHTVGSWAKAIAGIACDAGTLAAVGGAGYFLSKGFYIWRRYGFEESIREFLAALGVGAGGSALFTFIKHHFALPGFLPT